MFISILTHTLIQILECNLTQKLFAFPLLAFKNQIMIEICIILVKILEKHQLKMVLNCHIKRILTNKLPTSGLGKTRHDSMV